MITSISFARISSFDIIQILMAVDFSLSSKLILQYYGFDRFMHCHEP